MARKKIVPKKLGSVKIPKNLRRIGDKALADPQVAGIVSGALVSMGALVAGREVVRDVADGASVAKALSGSGAARDVSDVVKGAYKDILQARRHDDHASSKGSKSKRNRDKETRAEDADQLH